MDRKKTIFCVIAGVALAGVVQYLGVRAAAAEALYPLERGAGVFSRFCVRPLAALWTREKLSQRVDTLSREVAALCMVKGDNERLLEENAALRAQLDFPKRQDCKWVLARVLGAGGALGASDFLRVGCGSLKGVHVGAAVATREGLVGRVAAVSPHTCEVALLSDPSLKVACEIESGDEAFGNIRGIVSGMGAGFSLVEESARIVYFPNPLKIRHVGRAPQLPPRALVRTTQVGGVFPKGLLVGYLVDGVHADATLLEREGTVIPAVDFSRLEEVFIRCEN